MSRKTFSLLFLGKAMAVPVFLFVYTKMYGGIENFDTGKFYHDATVIYDHGKHDLGFLFRLLVGLQDDTKGSPDYEQVLKYTYNWDNGTVKDYLYNDNRVVIRVHVFLSFLTFHSYMAHALLNCFLGFIGILFLYKACKEWFAGKELWVLFILCFFPALWFYTGALLKEGITIFVLGCSLWQIRKFMYGERRLPSLAWLLFLIFVSILLKPYLLLFAEMCFALFLLLHRSEKIKRKILYFFSAMALLVVLINLASLAVKHRSLLEAALKQQNRFTGVSRGGIFLADSVNFIRLTNDTTQLKRVAGRDRYTIRKDVSYMYWKTVDQKDTLFCIKNKDTTTLYQLAYIIQPSQSNITLPHSNPLYTLAGCLYYTLFYPTFFSARNALQALAAFENLFVIAALLILVIGLIKNKKDKFLPVCFLFLALSLCLLIGLTAPNSGAIFRYRSPAMVFLLLGALYYLEVHKLKRSGVKENK